MSRKGAVELDEEGLALGTVVSGKYRLEGVLGGGGMGLVLAARHLQLDERVAIKFLRRELARDSELSRRFLREGQAAVRLKSEHVARVLDVGTRETGTPYLVMEMLDGQDLDQMLADAKRMAPGLVVDFVLQSCLALAEAHAIGIVHRDLKPSNFFVTWRADGSPLLKLLDFGISKVPADVDLKLTGTQSVLGTPAYMSPEQMRSARMADPRSDLWSLGAVCYELICGHRPFEAQSFSELCVKVALDPPLPVDAPVPAGLEAVIQRCLEKQPEQRFQTVAELAVALLPFAADARAASWMVERTQRIVHRAGTSQTGRGGGQGGSAPRPGSELGAVPRPGSELGAIPRPGSELGAGSESGSDPAGRSGSGLGAGSGGGWGAGSGPVQRPAWAVPAGGRALPSRPGAGVTTPSGSIGLPPPTPSGSMGLPPTTPSGSMGLPAATPAGSMGLPATATTGDGATVAAPSGLAVPTGPMAAPTGSQVAPATALPSVSITRPRRRWPLVAAIAGFGIAAGVSFLALRHEPTAAVSADAAPSDDPDRAGAVVHSLAPDAAAASEAALAADAAAPAIQAAGAAAGAGSDGGPPTAGAAGAIPDAGAGPFRADGAGPAKPSGASSKGGRDRDRSREPRTGTRTGTQSNQGTRTGTPSTPSDTPREPDGETSKDDDIFGKRK